MKQTKAYFDGSCKINPGEVGSWGFHIQKPYYTEGYGLIQGYVTNNIAEYLALIRLMEELKTLEINNVSIFGDSQLIIKTVNKEWGMKKGKWKPHRNYPILNELSIYANELMKEGNHTLTWIRREKNSTADSIAEMAYWNLCECTKVNESEGIKVLALG